MKKRGFTLTELLGVIVVLGLIALIIFPSIAKSIKSSRKKLYNEQVNLIVSNARRWGVEHSNLLPSNGIYYLSLNDLIASGYVSQKEIKDPRDESTMSGCVIIYYEEESKQYQYRYEEASCKDNAPVYQTFFEKMSGLSGVASNDPNRNLRYVGTSPNNYVKFNNEIWRVIGVFDGQAKIIRDEFYNSLAWDNNNNNDWSLSTLQTELNTRFYNSIEVGSKGYIDNTHVWKLGGGTTQYTSATRSDFYSAEQGSTVYTGRPTEWTGAIGLMYPSDFAYASDGLTCDSTALYKWNESFDCYNSSWLHDNSYSQWTLTPRSDLATAVFSTLPTGAMDDDYANYAKGVRPVLYLKSSVKIKSGSGSSTDPFILTM